MRGSFFWCFNPEALETLEGVKGSLSLHHFLMDSWDRDLEYCSVLLGQEYSKRKFGNCFLYLE